MTTAPASARLVAFGETRMFYFVARTGPARELIEAAKLEYALAGGGVETTIVGSDVGPGGLGGTVLQFGGGGPLPKLVWHKIERPPADETLPTWMGWNEHDRPGPASLARPRLLTSGWARVLLADGREWAVPLALPCTDRDPRRASQLPALARVSNGADGKPAGTVGFVPNREYDDLLFALSRALERELTQEELIEHAAALLGVGYRVSLAEVAGLGLLTQETAMAVILCAVDFYERVAARAVARDPVAGELVRGLASELRLDEGTAGRVAVGLAMQETS